MRIQPSRAGLALVLLLVAQPLACGPSVQILHEGTVRFEHCYRLDLDPRIAPSHRRACWSAWRERYSYGQPRDRIEHAQRRVAAIDRGEPPPQLQLEAEPQGTLLEEPEAPIDAHAPPPRVVRPTSEVRNDEGEAAPGDECLRACKRERARCLDACEAPSGEGCPCEGGYRDCAAGCFE